MQAAATSTMTATAAATFALAAGGDLVLGVGGAIGFRTDMAETLFVLATLSGWAFLVWATIVGAVGVAQAARRVSARRAPAWYEVLLLSAGLFVVGVAILAHPLVGTGSGAA